MIRSRSQGRSEDGECPRCGCPEADIVRKAATFGSREIEQRCCTHCGLRFRRSRVVVVAVAAPVLPPTLQVSRVIIDMPVCPQCGGITKVTSTRTKYRWHRCIACSHPFKTPRGDLP